jgi:hypothetical protein
VQSSDHPSIDYLGHEAEAGSADSLLKHYVGAYDPATGTLQIMEARKMVVRGTVRSHEAAPESIEEKEIMTVGFTLVNRMSLTDWCISIINSETNWVRHLVRRRQEKQLLPLPRMPSRIALKGAHHNRSTQLRRFSWIQWLKLLVELLAGRN